MRLPIKLQKGLSVLGKYRIRLLLGIAIGWTLMDQLIWIGRPITAEQNVFAEEPHLGEILLIRASIVMSMSILMGYLLIYRFKKLFTTKKRLISVLYKTLILLACSFLMNFLSQFAYFALIKGYSIWHSAKLYWDLPSEKFWLAHGVPPWLLIFLITQLLIEVNEKYGPGVFRDIMIGKYRTPKDEKRIVMFLDLKDSTPIAEKLGHKAYFSFIRDFINLVSEAIISHNGRIYQYVGDEVVVSWPLDAHSGKECIATLVDARKALQTHADKFRRAYNQSPEFRAGLHAGEVTVGEIGVIKKDLAMSGDTMNTAARIRTACSELNQKYLVSQDFLELVPLSNFQTEYLGKVELKGKKEELGLFALRI